MLTNNKARHRGPARPDAANPRPENLWGQVLEITPADGDHAADRPLGPHGARRRPGDGAVAAAWNPATSEQRLVRLPGQLRPGPGGRLWVSTDQGRLWKKASGGADGVWALETEGAAAAPGACSSACRWARRCAARASRRTAHPVRRRAASGRDGAEDYAGFERSSTFEDPATRWPDFQAGVPPRPSVVVITKDDGGEIGG
jgi:secreted PhoX family phosphatase